MMSRPGKGCGARCTRIKGMVAEKAFWPHKTFLGIK